MKITQRGFIVPLLLVIIALLLAGGGAYVYTQKNQANPVAVDITTQSQATTTAQSSNPAGIKTFVSEKLGIKFNYLVSEGEQVVEEGNSVYVGRHSGVIGQFVKEFSKDPKDDLATAIQKRLLSGISDKECAVEVSDSGSTSKAAITIVGSNGTMDDPLLENNPCPPEYRSTNGVRYFWMDKNHPDHFFFFSIGQYLISGEPPHSGGQWKSWQDTFEVIK